MFITNWLGGLQDKGLRRIRSRRLSCRRNRTGSASRGYRSCVLSVETLEDRAMLTGFLVNTLIDDPAATAGDTDGYVSLREAITAANTNATFGDAAAGQGDGTVDTISFDVSLTGQSIVLSGAELTVSDDLTLTGLGVTDLTISGDHAGRVFSIDAGVTYPCRST